MEELTEMPVSVELASDFNDRRCPLFRSDICVFVSQSGETKDTLEALNYAKSRDAVTLGVVNVVGSEISRLTDCGMHLNAGCEIGVASTKAYTSQIIAIVMIALQLSSDRRAQRARRQEIFAALSALPAQVEAAVKKLDEKTEALARRLQLERSILLFGRGCVHLPDNLSSGRSGGVKKKKTDKNGRLPSFRSALHSLSGELQATCAD